MDLKKSGASLDSLITTFNTRIAELQELVIARNSESIWSPITSRLCISHNPEPVWHFCPIEMFHVNFVVAGFPCSVPSQ